MESNGSEDARSLHDTDAFANPQLEGTVDDGAPAEEVATTNFFSLSPELRNRIYEESLVEQHPIIVSTAIPLQEPALLTASRQIRAEARPIWWFCNIFEVVIDSCDIAAAIAFEDIAFSAPERREKAPKIRVDLAYSGTPNWYNLMAWCQNVHSGEMIASPAVPDGHPQQDMIAIVNSATTLAGHLEDQSWAECKKALDIMRPSLGRVDRRWLINS